MLRRIAAAACAAASVALAAPASAVVILDSTWAEEGGTPDDPAAGFGAAKALANEPQFAASVALRKDGGAWGACSGVWIGNDEAHAYVLTAAHCFKPETNPEDIEIRTSGGAIHRVVSGERREGYRNANETTGLDLAILVLDAPIDDVDEPATLYAGDDEAGRTLTFVGYGSRGIGSVGQADEYYDGLGDKAAAQGAIDVLREMGEGEDGGNYLGVFLPKEDGSIPNPYGGADTPVSRLAGLLGNGDSGGPAYIETEDGWAVAGINSNSTGNRQYGKTSWFVRVSGSQDWILERAPMAVFAE